jgi:hypothetical protein
VGDGYAGQQLPKLLVVADRQQHVARDDAGLLVVPRGVPGELQDLVTIARTNESARIQVTLRRFNEQDTHFGRAEDVTGYLSCEVLEDGGEVDRSAGADTVRVAAHLEVAANTADGELEPGLHGPRYRLLPGTAGLAPGRSLLHLPASSGAGGIHGRCRASKRLLGTRLKRLWKEVRIARRSGMAGDAGYFKRREDGRWWARRSACSGRRAVGS